MRRDDAYLLDILLAARQTLKFMEGVSREEFEDNELLQNAVMRPLEIIGEAAARPDSLSNWPSGETFRPVRVRVWHRKPL